MNITAEPQDSIKGGKFDKSVTVSFSRKRLLHGISQRRSVTPFQDFRVTGKVGCHDSHEGDVYVNVECLLGTSEMKTGAASLQRAVGRRKRQCGLETLIT